MRHVFIIGSRGLPAKYGGFETFVDELVTNQKNKNIKYHVANLSESENHTHYDYNGADVFNIKERNLGGAKVIFYDLDAINYSLKFIKDEEIEKPIFYILGNTIGAFISPVARKIHQIGGLLFVNPDGLEWRRSKWSYPIRKYLKYSERKMVEKADLIIADNQGIDDYLKEEYKPFMSQVIAYGTDIDEVGNVEYDWYQEHDVIADEYYLVVGRFVPENNYETIIKSFMDSNTTKDLVIITNNEGSPYYEYLKESTNFEQDNRINFVGTVYDKDLLKNIRKNAYGYIHGHEVGGTNPGLLEAMWSTSLNLVLDVSFNRNVGSDSVLYWQKDQLSNLIDLTDDLSKYEKSAYGSKSSDIILKDYTWEKIVSQYEELFTDES
ncbi:beta 1-4 rhamnosyltransferase Cps2T [Floricoccus penangensis]|uniref:beta 1-4 rhamnosyltransferase Cps2T n=1 Tax=Floricoccus penangensis TaxID=1859475 RepID=UPI00203E11F4|nr:DUF1972 domain-containing protein [Floricoccus penangensis]URZ87763.1 DUF1972 domain-containing protein [Floricoccus penangensis]